MLPSAVSSLHDNGFVVITLGAFADCAQDSFTDLLTKGSCTVTLKDAFFLGNPQVGSEVYVRLCYLAILEAHKLYEEKRPGIAKITIGTPGKCTAVTIESSTVRTVQH